MITEPTDLIDEKQNDSGDGGYVTCIRKSNYKDQQKYLFSDVKDMVLETELMII